MGWIFSHREKGMSNREFFQHEFSSVDILDCASTLSTAYMAAKTKRGEIVALICLIRHQHNDWHNFGYKDMDETMGPYSYDCPLRILDQLTPTTNEHALRWREQCRTYHTLRNRLMAGCVVRFATPMTFSNEQTLSTFLVKSHKGTIGFFDGNARQYSIPNWYQYEMEILSEEMSEVAS